VQGLPIRRVGAKPLLVVPARAVAVASRHVDVLKATFPENVIGLSTHEYTDWQSSMLISYAKGARTWERHIDIPYPTGHEQSEVSPYCSLPGQIDTWFKAYRKAQEMCGAVRKSGREIGQHEIDYLNALKRGAYLVRDVQEGEVLSREDFFFAIPLQHEIGQLPSGLAVQSMWRAKKTLSKNSPVTHDLMERLGGYWPSAAAE